MDNVQKQNIMFLNAKSKYYVKYSIAYVYLPSGRWGKPKKQESRIQKQREIFGGGKSCGEGERQDPKKAWGREFQALQDKSGECSGDHIENYGANLYYYLPGISDLLPRGFGLTPGFTPKSKCTVKQNFLSILPGENGVLPPAFLPVSSTSLCRGFAVIGQGGHFLTFLEHGPSYAWSELCRSAWKLRIKSFHSSIYKSPCMATLNFNKSASHVGALVRWSLSTLFP